MTKNTISVKGAKVHNLKNIDVEVEKNSLTVITGLSGCGKSSLAFDTIYAEGQRRFIDSLSTYARNFLMQLKKPDVDEVNGLCPSVAIDQKTTSHSPRSTVGTVTEIYDYLRLLYTKIGRPRCPEHDIDVTGQSQAQIVQDVMKRFRDKKIIVMARVAHQKKGEFRKEIAQWVKDGHLSAKIDGKWAYLDQVEKLTKTKRHDIDIVVDQFQLKNTGKIKNRLEIAIENSLGISINRALVEEKGTDKPFLYSTEMACPKCSYSFPKIDPLMFSFNNPKGSCETCGGLGTSDVEEVVVEEKNHSAGFGTYKYVTWKVTDENPDFDWKTSSKCSSCLGSGLSPVARSVFVYEQNIWQLSNLPISELFEFLTSHSNPNDIVEQKILEELKERLSYLLKAGVSYLSLSRRTKTLSGGEAQRIRLATQVGAPLVGVLYVLDEPSIGLHPRDHKNILGILRELRDRGNTVIVVEHDDDTIKSADRIIDIGPLAGKKGGEVIFSGPLKDLKKSKGLTGDYFSGRKSIPIPKKRRAGNGNRIKIKGASGNNLKNVSVEFPLGQLIGVSGVSGSGKSTLIMETLYKNIANQFLERSFIPSPCEKVEGLEHIESIIQIDQKPIGRTPRSCPATYVGLFPLIRTLFTQLPESKIRGYKVGRFSFNVKEGRCETCQGGGTVRVRMQFLSDVYVHCDVCNGMRYNYETLKVEYKGKNIGDVLKMEVGEALEFFSNHRSIARKLETLKRVGLDYLTLGQPATTLSGGEAQRLKLSRELSKRLKGSILYILDEPTTGLHTHDISKLMELLSDLADLGHTVLVIEHNLDVLKYCDSIIDMGPEGGVGGGQIIFQGTPEKLIKCKASITGQYLKEIF